MRRVGIILLVLILALGALSIWQRARGYFDESTMASRTTQATILATRAERSMTLRGPLAPDIVSDTWLNSPALVPEELRGKVVVIEFWTFG